MDVFKLPYTVVQNFSYITLDYQSLYSYILGLSEFQGVITSDLLGSGKASDTLLMIYFPFTGLSALAILRGLLPLSGKITSTNGKRPLLGRKKRI